MLLLAGLLAAARHQPARGGAGQLPGQRAGGARSAAADGFLAGIPPPSRTLVVVPAMLADAAQIDRLVEGLEVRFLANRDENLHFALLTDFHDADQETLPADEALAQRRARRHRRAEPQVPQRASASSSSIARAAGIPASASGWATSASAASSRSSMPACAAAAWIAFRSWSGETAVLRTVKYVITLDTDTQLPRDAARRLVGAMAHPLNRPSTTDAAARREATASCSRAWRQPAERPVALCAAVRRASPASIPYTRAVSDVYQDLFGEGSFIGKGIYDVDAFERALAGRFPENRILSHDLLEGCYARAGLLSDVELYEEYPSRYSADVSRRHRWIRGDWQIARWLLPRVPVEGAARHKNPLSWLSQWKILDNLRRSRRAGVALVALLFAGWTPGDARDRPGTRLAGVASGGAAQARRRAAAPALRRGDALVGAPSRAGGLHARVPALRGVLQPGRDRCARRPHAGHPTRLLEWTPVRASAADRWRLLPVDRCGSGRWSPSPPRCGWRFESSRARARGAGSPPVARLARHRLVDQPSARAPGSAADAGRRSLSCARPRARPGRSSRPSSARRITGCRRTTTRSTRWRSSRTAPRRPTWGWRCWRTCRRTTSAISAPAS